MPKTVNTGFVCSRKASSVRTPNFFSSQAQSFTNKYKKMGIFQKMEIHTSPTLCLPVLLPVLMPLGDGLKSTYDGLVFSSGSCTHTIILGL